MCILVMLDQKVNADSGKAEGQIDMISTARQLQEKCQEQKVDLCMTCVDLTKAFDTVSRDGLWKTMTMFGCLSSQVHSNGALIISEALSP